jgi:hypothetical protein
VVFFDLMRSYRAVEEREREGEAEGAEGREGREGGARE